MKVEKHPIHYTDQLLNIRIVVNEAGYWAIDKAYNFVHNDKVICSLSDAIFFEEDSWIHLYSFDEHHFLLFDGHDRKGDNVWILNKKGEIIRSFSIGNEAIKIHVQERKVIVAYSELLDSAEKKVIIFDEFGHFLKAFNMNEVDWEVKAFCKKSKYEMIIHAYDKFHIQVLNLNTLEITTYQFLNNPELYYSNFVLYSPSTEYVYFGSRDDYTSGKDDPNTVYMNVLRGKLNEATQSIKFEFFERLDSFRFYISLENAKLIQLKTGAYYFNQDQAYYHIISLEE